MNKSNKRLENELKNLSNKPVFNCVVVANDANVRKWTVHMPGPHGSPFEDGVFELSIDFPDNYPFKAPDVKFVTKMYHPNIKQDTGEICMDVFASSWSPTQKVADILEKLVSLLISPSTSSPLEADICKEYMNNPKQYEKKVRDFVKKYANKK
jgi:ubiquitin-conjugating enzyme E2 D/E